MGSENNSSFTLFYHPNSSPCRVVWCFLLENHIQCKLELVNLFQNEQLEDAFKELNPAHAVPTLVNNNFVISESASIVRYLTRIVEKIDVNWYPKDIKEKALVDQYISWSRFHIRESVNVYLNEMVWKKLQNIASEQEDTENAKDKLLHNLGILEKALNNKKNLVGDKLTLCDLVIAEELVNLDLIDFDFGDLVNIQQWLFFIKQKIGSWDKVHQFFYQVYKPTIQKALK